VGQLAPVHLLEFWKKSKLKKEGNTPNINTAPKINLFKKYSHILNTKVFNSHLNKSLSQDSVAGTATGYGPDDRGAGVRVR
jgi:hypothetical protein